MSASSQQAALLREALICDRCGGDLPFPNATHELACPACGRIIPLAGTGAPLFTAAPAGLRPSEKIERGPESGTPWRRANWRFLEQALAGLPAGALILDVGAGRGDFAALLQGRRALAVDIYPYPEVDLVCDLTRLNPLRPAAFDAILLMNVLEHVADTGAMLGTLGRLLKPGGLLVVAIPFMVKIHQAPVDYVRYTHYALEGLAASYGLEVHTLEGYYDPVFFLGEALGNLRHAVLPGLPASTRRGARLLLELIQAAAGGLSRLLGPGRLLRPAVAPNQVATGYHVIYRKPELPASNG